MTIKKQLEGLGCKEIRKGIYRHPDIKFDFDFSATSECKVLLRFAQIFAEKGYDSCRGNLKSVLGIPD